MHQEKHTRPSLDTASAPLVEAVKTVAMVGTFPPRKCGIATFTQDLRNAIAGHLGDGNTPVVAMDDGGQYDYADVVEFQLPQDDRSKYRLTAELLNVNRIDIAMIQHEYGIFGGDDGSYVLDLMARLHMPIITTLHTVFKQPSDGQREVLNEIVRHSARVVVMSQRARKLLNDVYSVPDDKIAVIPHGIHDLPFGDPRDFGEQFKMTGKRVLLTFGLLGPGKGIEVVIRAMPKIVEKHPNATYIVVVGATHPHVLRDQGERYRHSLQKLAVDLGVADHVVFHDKFVPLEELGQYLGLAEIYVLPYPNPAQITSGTLAYAVGAGKAVVSTPIWHAEELLENGRGLLFPFNDSDKLAENVCQLLADDAGRNDMRTRAYEHGRSMIWSEVGRAYVALGQQVMAEGLYGQSQNDIDLAGPLTPSLELDEQPSLEHMVRLTDDCGLLQHATFGVPDRRHGYCTDDNARALIAALAYQDLTDDPQAGPLAERYLSFLAHAFDENRQQFRNFMGYDRNWLEDVGSDDSNARALWSLGYTAWSEKTDSIRLLAYRLFKAALERVLQSPSPRSQAFALLGMHYFRKAMPIDAKVNRLYTAAAQKLCDWMDADLAPHWPWPETKLTYDNARLPQALILAGHDLSDDRLLQSGLRHLDWLAEIQIGRDGVVSLVSHHGWSIDDVHRPMFDQQPVEAAAMVEACASAYRATNDVKWFDLAKHFHLWFHGNNALGQPVRDATTGGCRDGLQASGVNGNQGAESTLAWISSSLTIRDLYRRALSVTTERNRGAVVA